MQNHEPQPGDRVALIKGNPAGLGHFEQALAQARILTVIRQMPNAEPGFFELSDGSLHAASELHLIERPESVEVEHHVLNDGTTTTHLKHASAPEPEE